MTDVLGQLQAGLSDRFEIIREIGRGGMAIVYLANDRRHDRKVALKVLRPELQSSVSGERFLREIRFAAQLQHPHILPLHDSGIVDQAVYYTMVLDAIRRAANTLRPPPLAVWLYGSVARGADEPSSDIDVALVSALPDPTPQADALRDAISAELPGRAHRVSVVALGPRDVSRLARTSAKFWRELERDAVVLAGDAPDGVLEQVKRNQKRR